MIQNINLDKAQVSAELHGYMYDAIHGKSGVYDYGNKLAYELVSNNEIKINDGLLLNYGRFMRIVGYETLTIDNGVSGSTRYDLIVAHFETDGINEVHDIRILKGTNNGSLPSPTQEDIYNGGSVYELPLYSIYINGLNVEKIDRLFNYVGNVDVNPNLLINSDFRNPINQRGATSYTGNSIYTIDRWIISANETLTIEDGYVRFKLNTAQPYLLLQQKVEIPKVQVPEFMTLSCKVRASQKAKMQIYDTDRYFEIGTEWSVLTITFTKEEINTSNLALQDNHFRLYIGIKDYNEPNTTNLPMGAYVDIEWAKLEVGKIATPLINRPLADEMDMCKRYYQKYYKVPIYTTSSSGVTYRGLLMQPMRTNPTMILDNLYDASANEKTNVTMTGKVTYDTNAVNLVLSASVGQYAYISYSLEAEVY